METYCRLSDSQDLNLILGQPDNTMQRQGCNTNAGTKMVTFSRIPNSKPAIYNLAFGDLNLVTGELNDTVISNNQDRAIVLATVANTIAEFCNHHGNHYIYAKGSTSSRTRLYQMGITSLWDEISIDFEVYGLKDNDWQNFEPK